MRLAAPLSLLPPSPSSAGGALSVSGPEAGLLVRPCEEGSTVPSLQETEEEEEEVGACAETPRGNAGTQEGAGAALRERG